MPALMARMPRGPEDRDHRVRYVACSAIPTHLHQELEDRYGAPWFELFGSTETGGDLTVPPEERAELIGSACIGRPFPHREVRIVDAEDRPVERGTLGEIVLRGASMMDGYFRDPEATATAFRSGWYHTGDLGLMDESGRVFFHGRSKDIIRRSGENVSAVEVESTIGEHPSVRLAACVPVADDLRGEEIKAIVVLRPGMSAAPEELKTFCAERLAYYKVPRFWEFRDTLPMTESQKIAKGQLRAEDPGAAKQVHDLANDKQGAGRDANKL
jgi:crotonobetaine/carnitine-CoA ligase